MTKLLFVVLFEKEQQLEATVEDDTGRRRRVVLSWKAKDAAPVPSSWFSMIEAEMRLQDSEASEQEGGRVLF